MSIENGLTVGIATYFLLTIIVVIFIENIVVGTVINSILILIGLINLFTFVSSLNPIVASFLFLILVPVNIFLLKYFTYLFTLVTVLHPPLSDIVFYDKLYELSFGYILGYSFSLTSLAIFCGSVIYPNSIVPQNIQILLFNFLFDALTLLITFSLLKWAIKKKTFLRIPLIIIIDIAIAALLACLSLYFGLLETEQQLTFQQTIFILFARNPENTAYELGAYFWAMHTTFLPTLIYLSIIAFALIGKYFTLPFMKLFKGASGAEKPHYAIGTTFTFIGACCVALAQFITWMYSPL